MSARRSLDDLLSTYGSDLSRWPEQGAEAKAELLRNPEFRRAWERERALDGVLAGHRGELEGEIARAGALARLRQRLERHAAGPLAGVTWRRLAAAVVVAGLLGGALDLMLPERVAEPLDVALVDPLSGFEAGAE